VSHRQNPSFFSFIHQRGMILGQQNHPSNSFFYFPFIEISDFHIYFVFSFVVLVRRCFVPRCCATLFVSLVSFRYLFDSLQIRRHEYSENLNIIICVGFNTLPFYAINMDVASLFTDSFFLFLTNFRCIDVLYQFE